MQLASRKWSSDIHFFVWYIIFPLKSLSDNIKSSSSLPMSSPSFPQEMLLKMGIAWKEKKKSEKEECLPYGDISSPYARGEQKKKE